MRTSSLNVLYGGLRISNKLYKKKKKKINFTHQHHPPPPLPTSLVSALSFGQGLQESGEWATRRDEGGCHYEYSCKNSPSDHDLHDYQHALVMIKLDHPFRNKHIREERSCYIQHVAQKNSLTQIDKKFCSLQKEPYKYAKFFNSCSICSL